MPDRVDEVLDERTATYGDYAENVAVTSEVLHWLRGPTPHPDPVVEETAHMVAHKAGRIIVGGVTGDSHVDMRGYMRLCAARCSVHPSWAVRLRDALSNEEADAVLKTLTAMRRAARHVDPVDVAAELQEANL